MATSTAKTLNQYFEDWLGTSPGSEQNVVRLVETGLPTRVINHLIDRGLTRNEVFDIIIPLRTWKHRKSRRESLSKEESERAIRTAKILARAQSVMGDQESALDWLRTPNVDLRVGPRFKCSPPKRADACRTDADPDRPGNLRLMFLWRISNHSTLDGGGGLETSGRWHTQGRQIVYLAESVPGALLEVLVHLELPPGRLPKAYRLLKVECPNDISMCSVVLEIWRRTGSTTRPLRDRWVTSGWLR